MASVKSAKASGGHQQVRRSQLSSRASAWSHIGSKAKARVRETWNVVAEARVWSQRSWRG